MPETTLALEAPTVEKPEDSLQPVAPARADYATRITPETAHKMHELARQARERAKLERANNPPPPEPIPTREQYVEARLARTRAHIEETDEALSKAKDPLDRERLSRSLAQLQEMERILAGRPLPGSHRPTAPRSAPRGSIEPV